MGHNNNRKHIFLICWSSCMVQFISKHSLCEKYAQHTISIHINIEEYTFQFCPRERSTIFLLCLTMNDSQKQSKPPRFRMVKFILGSAHRSSWQNGKFWIK